MPRQRDEVLGEGSVSVGVVGLGYWGPNYLRVIDELPLGHSSWVCDVDPAALEFATGRHPSPRTTRDYRELLADPAVQAVVVATPPETHAEIVGAALDSGKHVLCEKPLATTSEDCIRLEHAARASGRVLMVGHTYIFNPAVRLLRRYVADGAIGRVRYVHSVRTGPGPVREGVNALWDLAPHDFAMVLYVVGETPVEVAAHGGAHSSAGQEGVVFASLGLTGDVLAHVHVSWLDALKARRVSVIGDTGTLVFDDLAAEAKVKLIQRGPDQDAIAVQARGRPYGEYRDINRDGEILVPNVSSEEPLRMQVLHFLECCRYDLPPETDAQAATRVVEVLEAASRSLGDDGQSVPARPDGAPSDRARSHTVR
jgi:predicted dehydrogenase